MFDLTKLIPFWLIFIVILVAILCINVIMYVAAEQNNIIARDVHCITVQAQATHERIILNMDCNGIAVSLTDPQTVLEVLRRNTSFVLCKRLYQGGSVEGCKATETAISTY
jgi:hypothetical protein